MYFYLPVSDTPLHAAASTGNLEAAKDYLNQSSNVKEDLEARNHNLETPLFIASEEGHLKVVQLLLEQGANIEAETSIPGYTSLHIACHEGHIDVVEHLLKCSANKEAKIEATHETPLHFALKQNKTDIVLKLIEYGANVNAVLKNHTTTLHIASFKNNLTVVNKLLELKINTEGKTLEEEATALHFAARDGYTNVVEALLNAGANPNSKNSTSITPFQLAISSGHNDVFEILLEHFQLVKDPRTWLGATWLQYAVMCGQSFFVSLLLQPHYGQDVNATFQSGFTALHIAAELGNEDIFGKLIRKKADVIAISSKGTILHHAAQKNYVRMVFGNPKCLEIFGSSSGNNLINLNNNNGQTALQVASTEGHADSVQVLLENGALMKEQSCNQLSSADLDYAGGNPQEARRLLKEGYILTEHKFTPLYLASNYGHLEVVKILLKFGANINAKSIDGLTPLIIATIKERLQVVQYLLEQKADPYIGNENNLLALHEAAIQGNLDVVKLLVPYYKSISVKDNNHQDPWAYAVLHGKNEIRKYLEEIRDKKGNCEDTHLFLVNICIKSSSKRF